MTFDLTLPKCGTAWAPDSTCTGVHGTTYMSDATVAAFSRQLLDRLRAMPGTENAALCIGVPFTDWATNGSILTVMGEPAPLRDRPNVVEAKYVTPGIFKALGIPLLRGRDFTDEDRRRYENFTVNDVPHVSWVGIVSEAAAKRYFHGDAIG